MKLAEDLVKKINRNYEVSSSVTLRYRNNDIVLLIDKEGNAVQMFIGKANEQVKRSIFKNDH